MPHVRKAVEGAVLGDPGAHRGEVEPVAPSRSRPEMSETASTVAPFETSSCAAIPPTLPNPCTTQRCSARFQPSRWQARSITITTPAPVASCRKSEPPSEIGLPVTISGTA